MIPKTIFNLIQSNSRIVARVLVLSAAPITVLATPMDLEIFTDFEEINPNQIEFTIPVGGGPNTATFTGGLGGIVGIQELYFSGSRAWMVSAGETGTIEFEADAAEVGFYARTLSTATGNSVVSAFDATDVLIDSVTIAPNADTGPGGWTEVEFKGLIARIKFLNEDGANMNAIDDFGFTPIPIPAAFWLFGSAIVGLIGFSTTKHS